MKFETINGQLCRMVEPAPLMPDSEMPCLMRPIKDGRLGQLNKCLDPDGIDDVLLCDDCNEEVCHYTTLSGTSYNDYYMKYEIIGYPVVEGSAEWAWYTSILDPRYNMVCGKYLDEHCVVWMHDCDCYVMTARLMPDTSKGELVTYDEFMQAAAPTGWLIYTEPEPKESPIDPIERPLRNLILEAKEKSVNIRTWYQDLIFTPESLTSYLNNGKYRWWSIGNWELTKRKANMPMPEPEPQLIDSGRWACFECGVKDSRKGHFPGCSRDVKPKSTYKVGDWVEIEQEHAGKTERFHRRVEFFSETSDANAMKTIVCGEFEFTMSGEPYDCPYHDNWHPVHRIGRKLDPSEVIIHIGCLSGTVRKSLYDDGQELSDEFLLYQDRVNYAIIPFTMLDAQTLELVESLLKAQEEIMKQCQVCSKHREEAGSQCPACSCDLPSNEASSEDFLKDRGASLGTVDPQSLSQSLQHRDIVVGAEMERVAQALQGVGEDATAKKQSQRPGVVAMITIEFNEYIFSKEESECLVKNSVSKIERGIHNGYVSGLLSVSAKNDIKFVSRPYRGTWKLEIVDGVK